MSKPSPAEVLRFMGSEESFAATLARFPELSREDLASLMENVARYYEAKEKAALAKAEAAVTSGAAANADVAPARAEQKAVRAVRRVDGAGVHKRIRVYSDGAARGNPGPAGAGAVLMGEDGEIVERLGRYLGTNTNNYAEYMGLILGLERARELGVREVEVLADSQLMIRQLGGSYKVKAENLKPLYEEALALLRGFDRVKLVHVPREQNKDADEMSNRAIDERM